jgi:hypothetical protein
MQTQAKNKCNGSSISDLLLRPLLLLLLLLLSLDLSIEPIKS